MSRLGIQLIAGTGKRRHARLRVRLPAKLITLDGEFRVVLCDLSTGGARVGKPGLFLAGGEAVLLWDRFEVFGTLAWCRSGLFGVHFEAPIAKEWVMATRELDSATRLPDDDELNRQAAREWIVGQARV
jgi:hypothetical protein